MGLVLILVLVLVLVLVLGPTFIGSVGSVGSIGSVGSWRHSVRIMNSLSFF